MEENVFHDNLIWLKSVDSTNEYLKKHKNILKTKQPLQLLIKQMEKGPKTENLSPQNLKP